MTDPSSRSSLIGVAISLLGNILISLALNCQKLAHVRLERENENGRKANAGGEEETDRLLGSEQAENERSGYGSNSHRSNGLAFQSPPNNWSPTRSRRGDEEAQNGSMSTEFLRSRLWWAGISLMTLGEFGNFLSYGFAPASLVAPLGAVALLSNVVISPIMLKEKFHPSDFGGISLAIIGAVTVVFSSKQSDATLNPDELWSAICQKSFIAYFIIAVGLAGLLAWGSTTRRGEQWILLDLGVCALLGGFTVLSTKGLSSLLSQGKPLALLRYPITYGLVVVLAGTALAQITYLNRALQRFDSREVIPTQFVMFTISAIVGSAILYRDFADMDAHQLINFLFGCLTTFAGVYFLTKQKEEVQRGEDSEASGSGVAAIEVEAQASQARFDGSNLPVAIPSNARPLAMGGRQGAKGMRAITTGSVPTVANAASPGSAAVVTLTPANNSAQSLSGSAPKFIVTRRSIFNPAFPVAFVESSSQRRFG